MSEMITREQLKQWRELAEETSDGEWTIIVSDGITGLDRAFIDAAREAVPALLDEVTRLRAEIEAHEEICADCVKLTDALMALVKYSENKRAKKVLGKK